MTSASRVCLSVLALGVAANLPAGEQPKKGQPELQGTWKIVGLEAEGEDAEFPSNLPRWVIKGDKVFYAGEVLARLTIDPATTPRTVDLAFDNPKRVFEAVYVVDGDTLKISVNRLDAAVKERPLDFETKDKPGRRLLVLEREKAGADDGTKDAPGFVGMQLSYDKDTGKVRIDALIEGSPAKKSGLKKDDIVLQVGDTAASDLKTVVDAVREVRPATDLTLRVERDGKELDIKVRVGVLPFFLFGF